MKAFISALSCLAAISSVAAHATFQDLWVNGVDQQATCDRLPLNNNPVQSVSYTVLPRHVH
jgi:cellulase